MTCHLFPLFLLPARVNVSRQEVWRTTPGVTLARDSASVRRMLTDADVTSEDFYLYNVFFHQSYFNHQDWKDALQCVQYK